MSRILSVIARAQKKKRLAKIATFILFSLIVGGLLYLTLTPGPGLRPRIDSSLLSFEKKVFAPVLHGITEKGEPYILSSQQGTQLDEQTIAFTCPKGTLTKPEGLNTLTADSALYHEPSDQLELHGNVILATPQGIVTTPSATAHLKDQVAQGTDHVGITSPELKIQGEGFQASEGRIKILKHARLVYNPLKSNSKD